MRSRKGVTRHIISTWVTLSSLSCSWMLLHLPSLLAHDSYQQMQRLDKKVYSPSLCLYRDGLDNSFAASGAEHSYFRQKTTFFQMKSTSFPRT